MQTITIALITLLTLAIPLAAQEPTTLFRNARIFDGERVLEDHDLLVEGKIITRLGQKLTAPAGAIVIDAEGKTLIPGLIDAHTHSNSAALEEALVFGVTTHLDMFSDIGFAQSMRQEQEVGRVTTRADLFSAGTLVTAPQGHGTQFGLPIPTLESPDSADSFIAARIAEGSDWIKLVYDDGRAYGIRLPTLDLVTLRSAIDAATQREILAVVHIGDAESARSAVEAGADGLVHLFTDKEPEADFISLTASRNAFVIPTLTVLLSITGIPGGATLTDDTRLTPYLLPASVGNLKQAFPGMTPANEAGYEIAKATVRQLRDAGVPILAGSDAPNPGTAFGASVHHELELLVDAGLTPTEALVAATSAPAKVFGLSDRGRIAPGLLADLVLVDGDPTTEITETRAIAGVWKAGHHTDRATFARYVADALAAANRSPAELPDGLVSDFEGASPTALIGSWISSPDNFAGGNSEGTLEIIEGGADGSHYALRIAGTIGDAIPFAWYGAMWTPGAQPMAPTDLSEADGFSFMTRGDGKTYRAMIFAQSKGFEPLTLTFETTDEWAEVAYTWADFGVDGSDIMGIVIAGGPEPGPFTLDIDNLRLR